MKKRTNKLDDLRPFAEACLRDKLAESEIDASKKQRLMLSMTVEGAEAQYYWYIPGGRPQDAKVVAFIGVNTASREPVVHELDLSPILLDRP